METGSYLTGVYVGPLTEDLSLCPSVQGPARDKAEVKAQEPWAWRWSDNMIPAFVLHF